jgi:hypothetical protein
MGQYLDEDPMKDLDVVRAVKRVRDYYIGTKYTGRRFDFLDGGGQRDEHVFTSDDIVAVSMLSVTIPPTASIEILEKRRDELSRLLCKIPVGQSLWQVPEGTVSTSSAASALFKMLKSIPGVGWVTAHKLLARKRPDLLPVYDRVVKARLQPRSSKFWIPLRNSLLKNDHEVVDRLEVIREEATLPDPQPSLLRILDVSIWMTSQG